MGEKKSLMSVHIVSEDNTPFKNRLEAGRLLGLQLEEYHGQSAVVLGIPRGGGHVDAPTMTEEYPREQPP